MDKLGYIPQLVWGWENLKITKDAQFGAPVLKGVHGKIAPHIILLHTIPSFALLYLVLTEPYLHVKSDGVNALDMITGCICRGCSV